MKTTLNSTLASWPSAVIVDAALERAAKLRCNAFRRTISAATRLVLTGVGSVRSRRPIVSMIRPGDLSAPCR